MIVIKKKKSGLSQFHNFSTNSLVKNPGGKEVVKVIKYSSDKQEM